MTRAAGIQGTVRQSVRDIQDAAGIRLDNRGNNNRRSRIGNRPFNGNTVRFNDRDFHIGSDSYRPSHYHHSGYHGYWNHNRNNWNNYGNDWGWGFGNGYGGNYYGHRGHSYYGYRPIGWGLGGWGLGSLIYNSGYLGYSNPYYVSDWSGYNYSRPIRVTYDTSVEVVEAPTDNSADAALNEAVAVFQQQDYDAALDRINKGIELFPDDAVLHEFRSLVLFAREDYQQSAATIHSVLAVGPGWDWTTLSGMYSSVGVYSEQLRALEAYSRSNPDDSGSRFLLAYHYQSCGHSDAAAHQLEQVVRLTPGDRVAVDVLRMLAPPVPEETQAVAPAPGDQVAEFSGPEIDEALLVGGWKAARDDGAAFGLTLREDKSFSWSFTQTDQEAQTFDGTYTVEGNVIALERKDGGSLIAEVTPGDGTFNFKLLGAPDDDSGLDFIR